MKKLRKLFSLLLLLLLISFNSDSCKEGERASFQQTNMLTRGQTADSSDDILQRTAIKAMVFIGNQLPHHLY